MAFFGLGSQNFKQHVTVLRWFDLFDLLGVATGMCNYVGSATVDCFTLVLFKANLLTGAQAHGI